MSLTHTEELRMVKAMERISESFKSIDRSLKSIDKSLKSHRIPEFTVSLDGVFSDEVGNEKEEDCH